MAFQCEVCAKMYKTKNGLWHHKRNVHSGLKLRCETCHKEFKSKYTLERHRKSRLHRSASESLVGEDGYGSRGRGRMANDADVGPTEYQRLAPEDPGDAIDDVVEDVSLELMNVYERNWSYIRTHYNRGKYRNVYNWRIDSGSDVDVVEQLWAVFRRELTTVVKVNISYGFVLKNIETNELRYYHSCVNEGRVLLKHFLVSNENDFHRFVNRVYSDDILDGIRMRRPNTKFVVHTITNVTLYVDKISNRVGPVGGKVHLPPHVKDSKYIIGMDKDYYSVEYKDNLCLFRCLAYHRGKRGNEMELAAKSLYDDYLEYFDKDGDAFKGVGLEQLDEVEIWLRVSINVFTVEIENDKEVVKFVQRSFRRYDSVVNVHLWGNHYSYISDIVKLSKNFKCVRCDKMFSKAKHLRKHERTCDGSTHYTFPKGSFRPSKTIFDRLEERGIKVPVELRTYPYQATYDIEVYFDRSDMPRDGATLKWTRRHNLASVSVCSNVDGFREARCFVREDDNHDVVSEFVEYLHDVSDSAYEILRGRFQPYFDRLRQLNDTTKEAEERCDALDSGNEEEEGEEEESRVAASETRGRRKRKPPKTTLEQLATDLDRYLREMPVFGFCSASFDMCVLKKYLMKTLMELQEPINFVIKKQGKYVCLSTERLRWLDAAQYLAAGCSLEQYLKAYGAEVGKEKFPYDWFTGLDKLNETRLPAKEWFYNDLKKETISDEDYQRCVEIFESKCETMRDYLKIYNNSDVIGLCECIDKQKRFYSRLGVDFSKDGVSLPGLSQRIIFKLLPAGVCFPYFSPRHAELYRLFRANIVGGQSIVLHRYAGPDSPGINEYYYGGDSKPVKKILGFDCTALYLYSMTMCPLPTDTYVVYTPNDRGQFKTERAYKFGGQAVDWLAWQEKELGCEIAHAFNTGEMTVGERKLRVDGYASETRFGPTVFEYLGCYFHSHHCRYAGFGSARDEVEALNHREELRKRFEYFETLGYKVITAWECEWMDRLEREREIGEFIEARKSSYNKCKNLSQEKMLKLIADGKLFGSAEVDIEVPPELREYFGVFQPVFKHARMSRGDLSPHMARWCEETETLKNPRDTLVNSYYGEKVLLYTPLLRWYLDHGLKVSRLYRFIEFKPAVCFDLFGRKVVEGRRAGDVNPANSVISNSWKLVGNSGYGRFLMNAEKHTDVKFLKDENNAIAEAVNSNYYKDMSELEDDVYEVESFKRTIKLNACVQLGHAILSNAKRRLLEFVYDCVDKFVDRRDQQLLYSDTDSAYFSVSQPNLFRVVKPAMRRQFVDEYERWFPVEYCDEHRKRFFVAKFLDKEWAPEACCLAAAKYDSRTPGKFHLEAEADSFVGLNSKTYVVAGGCDKHSSKGLSHKQNRLTADDYLRVLKTKSFHRGVNKGFRKRGCDVFTYEQEKCGMSYFYGKRRVLDDGVTCLPTYM